jgi:hypothetical protein
MGEDLFNKWLEEEVEDIHTALLMYGIVGILENFENWLKCNNYIKE